jgi:hypothetical protein
LRRAGRHFLEAAKRQQRIDAWIDRIAVQTLPPRKRFSLLYEALRLPAEFRSPAMDEVAAYLDTIGKRHAAAPHSGGRTR